MIWIFFLAKDCISYDSCMVRMPALTFLGKYMTCMDPMGMSSHLISFNPTQKRSEVVIAIVMIDRIMTGQPTPLTYHLQK